MFAPLGARARWAVALLAATLVVDVIAIAADLWQVTVIERFLDGDGDTAALTRSDDVDSLAATLQLLVFVATAFVFLRWFSRAYRNTAALATSELRFKPGWAIGGWFVPILSFWRRGRLGTRSGSRAASSRRARGSPHKPTTPPAS